MGQHWNVIPNGVIKAYEALGYLVKKCAPGPMKHYFTVSRTVQKDKDRGDIIELLRRKQPDNESDMGYILKEILKKWWEKNSKWLERGFENGRTNKTRETKGLDLYIFTDGVWQDLPGPLSLCGVDRVVNNTSAKLRENNRAADTIRFHFIHFGNDARGSARMRALLDVDK
jgi:hypothetical protein